MYIRFNASQSVEIAVPDERVPIQHYLRQPRRLVNALVDRTRTEQLSDDCFRLKMRPLQFMMLSIQPTVDLKGKADLEVQVELPPPFWLTPKPILEATGNGLLKSVLLGVKQRLMYQLLLDYRRWASSETEVISSDIPQILSVEG
ncbi:MAG: DUF1997 domain-containing protein [Oscillatoriales cyanobacterium]|nr:MAG: DUF1997 domain-containing protein [Oscillatoriales cyanobacterium]